jgi:uncharacterized protein
MPRIEFPAEDGTVLEGRLTAPDGDAVGGAVLCHPHPEYGGSMDSWMMPVLQRAVVAAGWTALRFNFRGVGRSAGKISGEDGAIGDVAGAVKRVREESDGPVLVGGWSLGARTALLYGLGHDVQGWFGVGLPVRLDAVGLDALETDEVSRWAVPKLFVHGTRDQFTSVEEIARFVDAAAEPKRLRLVEGGDHFLAQHGDVLAAEVRDFAESIV